MLQKGKHTNSKYYRCKVLPQVINHTRRKLGPCASEQAGCICSMTMPPQIKLTKWETIWLSTSQGLAPPSLHPWPCPLWCLVISFVDRVYGRNEVHLVSRPSKRGQFTAQMGASLWVWDMLQEMDPKAEAMYKRWRRVRWRNEIDIIWCMCNLNERKPKWQKLLIHPHISPAHIHELCPASVLPVYVIQLSSPMCWLWI